MAEKPITEPKVVPSKPTLKVEKTEKELVLEQIQAVLGEYKKESDIPMHHEYWKLVNKYRGL